MTDADGEETHMRRRKTLRAEWGRAGVEPRVGALLSDPIVRLLMQSDGITPEEVGRVVDEARAILVLKTMKTMDRHDQ